MTIENFITLSIVIEVITLICFFILCNNVSCLKKSLANNQPFGAMFSFYLSIGQKEKAKELLIKSIANEEIFKTAFFSNSSNAASAQSILLKKYKYYLEAVDLTIEFDKANEFISKL